eukprot:gene9613-biopygen9272
MDPRTAYIWWIHQGGGARRPGQPGRHTWPTYRPGLTGQQVGTVLLLGTLCWVRGMCSVHGVCGMDGVDVGCNVRVSRAAGPGRTVKMAPPGRCTPRTACSGGSTEGGRAPLRGPAGLADRARPAGPAAPAGPVGLAGLARATHLHIGPRLYWSPQRKSSASHLNQLNPTRPQSFCRAQQRTLSFHLSCSHASPGRNGCTRVRSASVSLNPIMRPASGPRPLPFLPVLPTYTCHPAAILERLLAGGTARKSAPEAPRKNEKWRRRRRGMQHKNGAEGAGDFTE